MNTADASGFKKVYLAMGFTDFRRGIDGLAIIVRFQFKLASYDKNTVFVLRKKQCLSQKPSTNNWGELKNSGIIIFVKVLRFYRFP